MKCIQARLLIDRQHDTDLTGVEKQNLHRHLAGCPRCAAYQSSVAALSTELQSDSELILVAAQLSQEFPRRLHLALEAENAGRETAPIAAVRRTLDRLALGRRHPMAVRMLSGAGTAAGLALALLGVAWLVHAPAPAAPEHRFAHMAAFSIHTSVDGRVYASLTQHESAGRTDLEEAHRP